VRPSRVSPRHERLGHRRQRLRLPVRVGDGAGHGLGLIVLAGCGQRPGYLRWTSCAATRSTAPAPVARVPGRRRSGLRAADPVRLPAGPERRGTLTCKQAAAGQARLGSPLRRDRIQRPSLVCLGVAGHRLGSAPPADPPPPDHRRTGLSLLLPARGPAGLAVPPHPRRRAALACRRRFRVWQGLLRARPVPGPAVYRDRPAHRAGHGRRGHLRRHRRPAPPPPPPPPPAPMLPDQPPPTRA
jgi:hypothetical protein